MERIAVLADVHGVAEAYEAALDAARAEGFDRLVILGDLLTYGVEPARTLALTATAVARDGAVLLLGNHDRIYLDRAGGDGAYAGALPDWIRESIEWTCRQTDDAAALGAFDWQGEWRTGSLLAAHANPFGDGDWRYLSTPDQMRDACTTLGDRGFRWGLFGHTHRFRRFDGASAGIVTVGSIGQPRDSDDRCPQWAMAELEGERFTVHRRRIAFDREAHVRAIRSTGLSPATMNRLCEFFP